MPNRTTRVPSNRQTLRTPVDRTTKASQELVAAAAVARGEDSGACCTKDDHPFDEPRCRKQARSALQVLVDDGAVVDDADAAARCVDATLEVGTVLRERSRRLQEL